MHPSSISTMLHANLPLLKTVLEVFFYQLLRTRVFSAFTVLTDSGLDPFNADFTIENI